VNDWPGRALHAPGVFLSGGFFTDWLVARVNTRCRLGRGRRIAPLTKSILPSFVSLPATRWTPSA
jgi:hypothetical protein